MNIGLKIKQLRREKNITQEELGELVGLSAKAISRWENSTSYPDIMLLPILANIFDVTVDDLCGNKRNSKIVTPRQIAMYLCREIISTPLKSIGKCLGNRDHTTIMHGIDKIEKEINNDENLKNTIETLKKKINPQG